MVYEKDTFYFFYFPKYDAMNSVHLSINIRQYQPIDDIQGFLIDFHKFIHKFQSVLIDYEKIQLKLYL